MNVEPVVTKAVDSNGRPHDWQQELTETTVLPPEVWQEPGYDAAHYAKVGLGLGALAGSTSLILNVIGSLLWPTLSGQPQHPLRLIQVYLTFPLGEPALTLNGGAALALGCVLYLLTGMLYGLVFELALSYFAPHAGTAARLVAASALALVVWSVNFYGLLAWLQPLLLGGRWIVELVPWWVAAATHLVFGWTMAMLYPLGQATAVAAPPEPR